MYHICAVFTFVASNFSPHALSSGKLQLQGNSVQGSDAGDKFSKLFCTQPQRLWLPQVLIQGLSRL